MALIIFLPVLVELVGALCKETEGLEKLNFTKECIVIGPIS